MYIILKRAVLYELFYIYSDANNNDVGQFYLSNCVCNVIIAVLLLLLKI